MITELFHTLTFHQTIPMIKNQWQWGQTLDTRF